MNNSWEISIALCDLVPWSTDESPGISAAGSASCASYDVKPGQPYRHSLVWMTFQGDVSWKAQQARQRTNIAYI
jgi:hypothetical protein